MPIKPENRDRYAVHHAVHIDQILNSDQATATHTLRQSLGFDVLTQPLFWECWVAQQLGGNLTAHSSQHDVEIIGFGRQYFAEVKYSRAFECSFSNGVRRVFKWARPRGYAGKATANACILIGLDVDGLVFAWVVPISEISPRCTSITVTSPSERKQATHNRALWERFLIPTDQILPAFLRCCHLVYDAEHHAETARQTRRARRAIGDLFGTEPQPIE